MKNKKLNITISVLIILLITVLIITTLILNNKPSLDSQVATNDKLPVSANNELSGNNNLPIDYYAASYAYSLATPEKAIGGTDYTFIAKVNGIVRTEYRHPVEVPDSPDGSRTKIVYDPYTIYDVTVIENIRGNLIKTKNIEIEQAGGLNKDGKYYIFPENTGLLNIGEYYIFSTLSSIIDGTLRVERPEMMILLGKMEGTDTFTAIQNIVASKNASTIEDSKNSALINKEINFEIIEKVTEYTKAALTPVVPEGKNEIPVKSKLYDVEYSK